MHSTPFLLLSWILKKDRDKMDTTAAVLNQRLIRFYVDYSPKTESVAPDSPDDVDVV